MMRKIQVLLSVLVILLAATTAAADYPTRNIRMVVPWAAGGGTDAIGRALAEAMKDEGASVIVDNITGAAGITGSIQVARANPDGYTILMNGDTDVLAAMVFADAPLSLDDFAFIGGFYETPTWILSHQDSGITSMEQFLQMARERPGQMTLGSATPAGAQMIMAAAIRGASGLDFRVIPYQGGADLTRALLGNQVDAGIIHAPVMLSEVEAGLINVIGTGGPLTNISYEPVRDVPTMTDIGVPVTMGITRGVFVPKDTPQEVVDALTELIRTAATSDNFAAFGSNFGFAPVWIPGPEFERAMRESFELFKQTKQTYID